MIKMTEAEKKQRNKSLSVLKVYNITIAATLRGDLFLYRHNNIALSMRRKKIYLSLNTALIDIGQSAYKYTNNSIFEE